MCLTAPIPVADSMYYVNVSVDHLAKAQQIPQVQQIPPAPAACPPPTFPAADGTASTNVSIGDAARSRRKGKLGTMCQKTKMCKFFLLGKCIRGSSCQFAHDERELRPVPDLSCTKTCPTWAAHGHCDRPSCPFAHGRDELRRVKLQLSDMQNQDLDTVSTSMVSEASSASGNEHWPQPAASQPMPVAEAAPPVPPLAKEHHPVRKERLRKTKMCAYFQVGHCVKGESCNFAHSPEDIHPVDDMRLQRSGSGELRQPQMQRISSGEACQPTMRRIGSGELLRQPAVQRSGSGEPPRQQQPAGRPERSNYSSEGSPMPPPSAPSPLMAAKPAPLAAMQVLVAAPMVLPPSTAIAAVLPDSCVAVRQVSGQAYIDPSLLPENPPSPFSETPPGAVANCADPFGMMTMMRGVTQDSSSHDSPPGRFMTRVGPAEEWTHWMEDLDRWSDSECGLFGEDSPSIDDE